MKTTRVLNLFAGPGAGKSTNAAAVFVALKRAGKSVELVREYVKSWAWEGRKIQPHDQLYFLGKQSHAEASLFGKVDYIVTDSPVLLSAYYAQKYGSPQMFKGVLGAVEAHYAEATRMGVVYLDALLGRSKPYVSEGRFETEAQARQIDVELAALVGLHGPSYSGSRGTASDSPAGVANLAHWLCGEGVRYVG